jgi:hypothetical protein
MLIATFLQVCSDLLALKDNCLTATTQTPYIKSVTGGINSSPEGFSVGSPNPPKTILATAAK